MTVMTELQVLSGMQEGGALVTFPKTYPAQVQDMIHQWSTRYDTLQDWTGPHKYEQTPIGQLLEQETDDPKVQQPCTLLRTCRLEW